MWLKINLKMCQIITGSDDAVPLTQHKMIFTGCTAARTPRQSDFVLTRKHHIKSMGLFILLHASEAFRSDRPSSSLASLTVKNGKKLSFFRPDSKLQLLLKGTRIMIIEHWCIADIQLEAYLQHHEYMIRGKIYTLLLMSLSLEGFH